MSTPADTVKRLYAKFEDGDAEGVFQLLDPGVEWLTPETLPWSRGAYVGHEQVREYFTSFADALAEPSIEPDQFIAEGDRVVVLGTESGTSRVTGRSFTVRFAHAFVVREERVVQMRGHIDTAAIREAGSGRFEP